MAEDKPPLIFPWINSPRVRRFEAWLWNHPKTAIALTIVSFSLITSPAWFADFWSLFSNSAPVPAIMNWIRSLPALNLSWYWLPVALGAAILIVILSAFWRERKRLEVEIAQARALPTHVAAPNAPGASVELTDDRRACSDKWLHAIADGQVRKVWEFVKLSKVGVWKLDFDAHIPTLKWGFVIKNNSVFPISLDGDVTGYLLFQGQKLLEQRTVLTNGIKGVGHLQEGTYMCEQRLSKLEADLIKNNPDGKFSFQGLYIEFKGAEGFEQVQPRQLLVPDNFEVGLDRITDNESQAVRKAVEPIEKERNELRIKLDHLTEATSTPPGNLVINTARYGVPGIYEEDVTSILAAMVQDNALVLTEYYNDFLPDKVQGRLKQLVIDYSHHGVPFSITVPENTRLKLPVPYQSVR